MDSRIQKLFHRYELGIATDEERKLVENWFESFNADPDPNFNLFEKRRIFDELDYRITNLQKNNSKRHRFSFNGWQAAAVLLIFSSVFAMLVVSKRRDRQSVNNFSYKEIATPNGTKKALTLPDGSEVTLNAGSKIKIPSNFGEKNREITLTGEAFFNIRHNAAKPFIIHSENIQITDIGTAFDVKAYPNENEIKVSVETGIVRIEKNTSNAGTQLFAREMIRNRQMVYNKVLDVHVITDVNAELMSSWRHNLLSFDNATFEEISKTLERWYNIPVKLNNKSANCRRYTLSFQNDSLEHVLNVLANLSDMTYKVKGGTVFINVKNCKKNM